MQAGVRTAPVDAGAPVWSQATGSANDDGGLHVRVAQELPMRVHADLRCDPGELLALVGQSGAGKTSLLRILAGLMKPQQGRVAVGGELWCDTERGVFVPPQARHVGLMFQNYALMPHLSAIDNVALALLHLPKDERLRQARQWLERVHLTPQQQARKPAGLSGGQQQRVAVARALARQPRLLLLDEPFSAVDQMLRQELYRTLAELRASLQIPIVLVTHDLNEARHLADSLAVMDAGEVLQHGSPAQLYRSPRNARVADLVGIQNRFHGVWEGPVEGEPGWGWLRWTPEADPAAPPQAPLAVPVEPADEPSLRIRVRDKGRIQIGQAVTWVVQSDGLHLLPEATTEADVGVVEAIDGFEDEGVALCAKVADVRHLGELTLATLALEALPHTELQLTLAGAVRQGLERGQRRCVRLDTQWVHVMPLRRR